MSKRAVTLTVALALVVGGAAGFAWHAPGRASTWSDVRTWAGFGIVVIGAVVALVQLDLQRRQLASQQQTLEGEVERNRRRDELLDKQLAESDQRAALLARQQAEQIALVPSSWVGSQVIPGENPRRYRRHEGEVRNGSARPIRNIACRIQLTPDGPLESPVLMGVYVVFEMPRNGRTMAKAEDKDPLALLRPEQQAGFRFEVRTDDHSEVRMTARFTDDAGLHWQIDHDLHLAQMADRNDW